MVHSNQRKFGPDPPTELQKLGAAPIASTNPQTVRSDGREQIIFWCERTIREIAPKR